MKIRRFAEDSYPERIQLFTGLSPVNLDSLGEVYFHFARYDEIISILCIKQENGFIMIPFEGVDTGIVGCFPFDVRSTDIYDNNITFTYGVVEFVKGYGDF